MFNIQHKLYVPIFFLKLSSMHYKGVSLLWFPSILRQSTRGSGSLEMSGSSISDIKGRQTTFTLSVPSHSFRCLLTIASLYKPQTSAPRGREGHPRSNESIPGFWEQTPAHHMVTKVTVYSCSQLHNTHSSSLTNLVWKVSQLPP
jgi:hypothetical protein